MKKLIPLSLAIVILSFAYLLLGRFHVSFMDFIRIMSNAEITESYMRTARFVIQEERLPRLCIGLLAGLSLGLGGTCFQLMLRNPLASPDVVGISAAASVTVVLSMAVWGLTGLWLSGAAFIGALCATMLIIAIAGFRSMSHFVLTGVAFSALFVALTHYLLTRINIYKAASASIWLTGSLGQATWLRVIILLCLIIAPIICLCILARPVHHLALGDELAQGLGIRVKHVRWAVIILGVVLTSSAVAATGPISFVGFMAGPVTRLMLGGRDSFMGSALVGAFLVIAADFIGREIGLPVGVITGIIGMPILLYFVVKRP